MTVQQFLIACFVVAAVFSGLGAYVAYEKGRSPNEGLVLGFLFGPLGCLLVAMLPAKTGMVTSQPKDNDDEPVDLGFLNPPGRGMTVMPEREPGPIDKLFPKN